jgi:nitroreductase
MQFMLAAKAAGYDTCPIGGFNQQAFIENFQVPERFAPIMLITVGEAAKEAYPTARKSVGEIAIYNSF